jgi:hypothetical protein
MDTGFSAQSGQVKVWFNRKFILPACVGCLIALFTSPVAAQPKPLVVSTVAGLANFGSADGIDSAAKFLLPTSVAVDGEGNVYVADTENDTIRKVTPAGVVTTLAGMEQTPGTNDGTGSSARFNQPYGVAVDSLGNVYVADTYNFTIRKITTNGVVTTIAGQAGNPGSSGGSATNGAEFSYPYGVAIDSSTNIYVADTGNNMIRMITNATGTVGTLAGSLTPGTNDGVGSSAQFSNPFGLATDNAGDVYVADTDNSLIRQVTTNGVVTTIASNANPAFSFPYGIAVDSATNIYVADTDNEIIRKITRVGTNWVVSRLVGGGFSGVDSGDGDGIYPQATFLNPWGVAVDSATNVYVGDSGNGNIRQFTPKGILSTLAGPDESYGVNGDGPAGQPRLNLPKGVAADGASNLYVADTYNNCIRLVTPAGATTTLAGSINGDIGQADGTNYDAAFYYPTGLCLDAATNIYVADNYNSTVRKITPDATHSNWVTTTIAGLAGVTNFVNATVGTNARFDGPYAVAVDSATNLYVTDNGNKAVRKLTRSGTNWAVTTYASGSFISPCGIAVDSSTNVYVADSGANLLYSIALNGVATPFATSGEGLFNAPQGVAVDSVGNVYLANTGSNTILGINAGGKVTTTIAGAAAGFPGSADGLGNAAQFYSPIGLAVDASGNVYVADSLNNTIRKGTPDTAQTAVLTVTTSPDGFAVGVNGTNYAYTPQVFAVVTNSTNTVTAATTNGYIFTNWTTNGAVASTSNSYTFTPGSNESLVANFIPGATYTLTVSASPANGGTVSGGGVFAAGSTITVTATTNSGYLFAGWTSNGVAAVSTAGYTFALGANVTLVANFLPLYTLTVGASPTNGGTVSGGGTFVEGSTNTVRATPNGGYVFANWTQGGTVESTSSNYTFTLGGNETLVANFLTTSLPSMSIIHSNGLMCLSWPSSTNNFTLESTTNFSPAVWVVVPNVPALSGGFFTVSNLWTNQMRFFRLATIARPLLSITRSNGVTLLFWTNSANTGFTLESATNVNATNWQVVTNTRAVSGGYFIVSNAWPDQTRFFQLILQ